VLIFSSCNKQANIQVVSLPDAVELTSVSKSVDVDLLIPGKIFIWGNKLIVFEQLHKDMFKVFDVNSLKYLYSFGNIGGGPEEFISVGVNDIIENSTEFVEIFDVNKLKYVYFSDSSAHITSEIPISLHYLKNPINRLRKMNDSIYYFDNIFEGDSKNEFIRLNLHAGIRTYFSPYPSWVKSIKSAEQKYSTYIKSSNYNLFYDKVVVFYNRFPVIKFLDSGGNVIKEIHVDTKSSKFNDIENNKLYFVDSSVLTDEYIYVLWVEKSKNEVEKDPNNFKPEILVFDWNGNVAGRYKLDRPIVSFTLSEETGKIYCTSFPLDDIKNEIFIYDLPKIDNDRMPLTRIQNSLYSLNILDGYSFSQVSLEDGIDKIVERDGLKTNINYFSQVRDKNGFAKYDLETIKISVYTPVDEIKKDWSENFLNTNAVDKENFKRREINIDELIVHQTTYYHNFLNPKNKIEKIYVSSYFFEKDNVFIEISINSMKDNLSSYHPTIKKMIRSFELKN